MQWNRNLKLCFRSVKWKTSDSPNLLSGGRTFRSHSWCLPSWRLRCSGTVEYSSQSPWPWPARNCQLRCLEQRTLGSEASSSTRFRLQLSLFSELHQRRPCFSSRVECNPAEKIWPVLYAFLYFYSDSKSDGAHMNASLYERSRGMWFSEGCGSSLEFMGWGIQCGDRMVVLVSEGFRQESQNSMRFRVSRVLGFGW